ncbi:MULTISPECIES: hypothetical protein [unclassified Pseudomonas]|uniref:hypothetical protein n=1 Tax=unclassified Pseudomonas TaxID=196821 RepID=UPI003DA80C6F
MFCLLLGAGGLLWFGPEALHPSPETPWGLALGVPLLGWCALGFGRTLLYLGEQAAADGWDLARQEDLIQKKRQGRRFLQVLKVDLHTALRAPGDKPAMQWDVLQSGIKVQKVQPSRLGPSSSCHSRLPGDLAEDLEPMLFRTLQKALEAFVPILAQLPDHTPLALLLEADSGLPDQAWDRTWELAWQTSAIRQAPVLVEGNGFEALDHWLDQRFDDEAVLLVIGLRFAPPQPEGTAEVIAGLLLGNQLTQTTVAPVALLHRPEQERQPCPEALRVAATQASAWVPMEPKSVRYVWRAGVDAQRHRDLDSVSTELSIPIQHEQGLRDLDGMLGNPGKASPWLAIVAATQAIEAGGAPQFIFSGDGRADARLWSMALTPAASISE